LADAAIETELRALIQRGASLQGGFAEEIGALNAPGADALRRLAANGVGLLVREFFRTNKARSHGTRLTASLLRAEKQKASDRIVGTYERAYAVWMKEVENFLGRISEPGPRVKAPGNGTVLVRRVKRANERQKLPSRFRFALAQLETIRLKEPIWNEALPKKEIKAPLAGRTEPGQILQALEMKIRKCIEQRLAAVSGSNWTLQIPADVLRRTERRKQNRESVWPWYPARSDSVADYLDFSDYRKIILDPENWANCFADVFKSQIFIEAKLAELEPVRNDIAHSRSIGDLAADKLRIYAHEIGNCISQSG